MAFFSSDIPQIGIAQRWVTSEQEQTVIIHAVQNNNEYEIQFDKESVIKDTTSE